MHLEECDGIAAACVQGREGGKKTSPQSWRASHCYCWCTCFIDWWHFKRVPEIWRHLGLSTYAPRECLRNRTHWRVHARLEQSSRWLSCRLFTVLCRTWLCSRWRGCFCEQEFIWIFIVFVVTLWSCPRGVKPQVGTLNNWIMTVNNNMDAQAGWMWMGSKCKQMIWHCVDKLMWSEAEGCWENVYPDLQYPISRISLRVPSNPHPNSNPTLNQKLNPNLTLTNPKPLFMNMSETCRVAWLTPDPGVYFITCSPIKSSFHSAENFFSRRGIKAVHKTETYQW